MLHIERVETLMTAVDAFKPNNPDWRRIQYLVIDTDFGEMKVLKEAFPAACVLLCQFHAIKWLSEEIANERYPLSALHNDRLKGVIEHLTYAKTDSEYFKHRGRVRFLL